MLLTPQPLSLRLPTLIQQFPQLYNLMPHILHPTTRCSIILWPFPPILLMPHTSMRTYKPVNLSCTHSIHSQTHIHHQGHHPPHPLLRVLGVNLILNSSIHSLPPISYRPLRNNNMSNSHRTINNNNNNLPYPRLLLTWYSTIIINHPTKILIHLCNTIQFNNKLLLLLLNNNNSYNNNSNFSHNSSNHQLLLEPPQLFQLPLIAVIHMLLMNPTDNL